MFQSPLLRESVKRGFTVSLVMVYACMSEVLMLC